MLELNQLQQQHCQPLNHKASKMLIPTVESYLSILPSWQAAFDYNSIERSIQFKNHYQVMAFLNALAYLSHQEDHHPDVCYGYNQVNIKLQSHIAKGVTTNDMIMAAKIEQLLTSHG